jgi:hypothetical protein
MKIGFIGPLSGMTIAQTEAFFQYVSKLNRIDEFHHCCCIGADEEAVDIITDAKHLGHKIVIVAHPCTDASITSDDAYKASNLIEERKPMREAIEDIANACDQIIIPYDETLRSKQLESADIAINEAQLADKIPVTINSKGVICVMLATG